MSSPASNASLSPPEVAARLKSIALGNVVDLLDAMFDNADQMLMNMADDPASIEAGIEPRLFSRTINELAAERATITQSFIEQFSHTFSEGYTAVDAVGGPELSFMAEEERQESSALENIAAQAQARLHEDLEPFNAYLQGLLQQHPGGINPAGAAPGGICHSFREALSFTRCSSEIKLLIYALFDESVLTRLQPTYRLLHHFLKRQKITPLRHNDEQPSTAAPENEESYGERWMRQIDEHQRHIPGEHEFGTAEVLRVFDSFQFQCVAHNQVPQVMLEVFQQILLKQQGDSTPRSMSRADNQRFTMVSALFYELFKQPELKPDIRELLVAMRIPIMKTAMIDAGFFREAGHPARSMVNEWATIYAVTPQMEADVCAAAKSLVARLNSQFSINPGVLETTAYELSQALHQQNQQAESVDGTGHAPDELRLLQARRMAMLEVSQQAMGRRLPDDIKPFLQKAWTPLMATHYLRAGWHSTPWRDAGMLLTRILDAASGRKAPQGGSEALAQEQAALMVAMRKQVRALSLGQAKTAELLEALQASFAQALAIASSSANHVGGPAAHVQPRWRLDDLEFDDHGSHSALSASLREHSQAAKPAQARAPKSQGHVESFEQKLAEIIAMQARNLREPE